MVHVPVAFKEEINNKVDAWLDCKDLCLELIQWFQPESWKIYHSCNSFTIIFYSKIISVFWFYIAYIVKFNVDGFYDSYYTAHYFFFLEYFFLSVSFYSQWNRGTQQFLWFAGTVKYIHDLEGFPVWIFITRYFSVDCDTH